MPGIRIHGSDQQSCSVGGGAPYSFFSRWWTWPLPPAGPLEFVCEWPAFDIAESRVGIDAQLILDAAQRSGPSSATCQQAHHHARPPYPDSPGWPCGVR